MARCECEFYWLTTVQSEAMREEVVLSVVGLVLISIELFDHLADFVVDLFDIICDILFLLLETLLDILDLSCDTKVLLLNTVLDIVQLLSNG